MFSSNVVSVEIVDKLKRPILAKVFGGLKTNRQPDARRTQRGAKSRGTAGGKVQNFQ